MRTGIVNMTLDYGQCPAWLFARMTRLGRIIALAIISEFGSGEFVKRLADPVWFQSLGTLMAFDWNASGLTIVTTAALKEALRGIEKDAGVFVCGGKGKTSRKTPEQITGWSGKLGFTQKQVDGLVYSSKAAAKVDSALIQDGFTLYHHSFVFDKNGDWAVVQQGMNTKIGRARRYHWWGRKVTDFANEPHSAIASQAKLASVLDLTSKNSVANKQTTLEVIRDSKSLYSSLKILAKPKATAQLKILDLPGIEFKHHPVETEFLNPQLKKAIDNVIIAKPGNFESLMMTAGVGPKTIRALTLVAEVIYGAKPSYRDPARYSFSFGGKDGTPYPVDRITYDATLSVLEKAVRKSNLYFKEKDATLRKINNLHTNLLGIH